MRPTRREQDTSRPTPEEHARVKRDLEESERERERLQRRIERLEKQNTRLRRELDAARRAGHRQAAPFAKTVTPEPKRPGRRAGAQYGQPARRRRPTRVDVRHDVPLPPSCPECGGGVRSTGMATQSQEELPVPRVLVREFRVALGACQDCGQRVRGRHRLQTSDALGAAAVQLGPALVASAVILNKQMGLSFGKIATLLRQHYGIRVSSSGLVRAVHRAAGRAEPTYSELRRQLRNSPVVTPDETGWKVGGHLQWLWAGASEKTTVYAIQPGRGYQEAAHLLGPDFDGVLIRDGWAPYRRFTRATHQTCLAHLRRRGRTLCRDHPRSRIAADIHALLKQALRLRDDARAGERSRDDLGEALEALAARLARRLLHPGPLTDVRCFAKHLTTEWKALFTFLRNPAIDATNWRAEQAIRPAVVTRKVCGGNRSWRGAATQQTLASVIRTAWQRQHNPHAVILGLLCSPTPTVAPDLQGAAP